MSPPSRAFSSWHDMSLLTRVLNLFRRRTLERELDEELRYHLERRIESNREWGMSLQEANAAAHQSFGDVNRTKREMQEVRVMRKPIVVVSLSGVLVLCAVAGVRWWSTALPTVIHEQKPYYTEEAMEARIQGSVMMKCVVQTTGICSDIRIVTSLDPTGLDQQAMAALRQWRFSPGTRFGEPVPVQVDIQMTYNLE